MPDTNPRFVSRLTRNTLALILAGGRGARLKHLTKWRSKPAVPFGGKFRIVDFPLSNCINSGIRRIGVLTQYKAHSLILHIQKGWGFLRGEFGEFVELWPAQQRVAETAWYAGTADAVFPNLDIIRMMSIDEDHRVRRFREKPSDADPMPGSEDVALASMGIYVFNRGFLFEQLMTDADTKHSSHDFAKDIIPRVIEQYRVVAYPFRDVRSGAQAYWRDVGTVDAFWEANLELIGVTPPLNLYDETWPIWTYQEQLPPAKFVFDDEDRRGMAVDSMVSGGCIISGATVRHSLLFSNVRVNSYSYVHDSVILPDVDIGRNCEISTAVIDRGSRIPEGMALGRDRRADKQNGFYVTESGVTLVTPEMLAQDVNHVR
ncbi:MAG: glucose-1-phosphate adenylyltransferase [Chromatiaceae bacterium]